jgi:hypothetical protein
MHESSHSTRPPLPCPLLQLAIVFSRTRQSSSTGSTERDAGVKSLQTTKQFVQALVRVALLVRLAHDEAPSVATSDETVDPVEVRRTAEYVRRFINQRVLPLSLLSAAEHESLMGLSQPDVVLCLSKPDNQDFLRRVFSYYADASRGGSKLGLRKVTEFFTDFEVIPKLVSRKEVERVFFAAAHRAETEGTGSRFVLRA